MPSDSAWSGSSSIHDASSRRGSQGSALAMLPAVTQLSEETPRPYQNDADIINAGLLLLVFLANSPT